jgi:hypothetical protein
MMQFYNIYYSYSSSIMMGPWEPDVTRMTADEKRNTGRGYFKWIADGMKKEGH